MIEGMDILKEQNSNNGTFFNEMNKLFSDNSKITSLQKKSK